MHAGGNKKQKAGETPRFVLQSWKVKVKVTQLCLTLCYSVVYTVHGILQVRILEWVAFPSPEDRPNPGIKPRSPALQVDFFLPVELSGKNMLYPIAQSKKCQVTVLFKTLFKSFEQT